MFDFRQKELASDWVQVYGWKYWAPVLLAVSGAALFADNSAILASALWSAAAFFCSVAQLEVSHNGKIRYRRYFDWKEIDRRDLVGCGDAWMFGYLRLKTPVIPWGRLYFVLDASQKIFTPDHKLLKYLARECGRQGGSST